MANVEPTWTRARPGWLGRLFFRLPVLLYHGWLADLFYWRCVMLVTTTGRRSGRPRTTGVSCLPVADGVVAFAGWGVRADWYRNLRTNPAVVLRLGRRRVRATAQVVMDPERRQALMLRMREQSAQCGPPRWMRPLLRLLGLFDYDREIALAVEHARELPVVEFIPHDRALDQTQGRGERPLGSPGSEPADQPISQAGSSTVDGRPASAT
jgi:deazaflavin-dependent oxidoreductase (nitroreductase family)